MASEDDKLSLPSDLIKAWLEANGGGNVSNAGATSTATFQLEFDHTPRGSEIIFNAAETTLLVGLYSLFAVLGLSFNAAMLYVILGESPEQTWPLIDRIHLSRVVFPLRQATSSLFCAKMARNRWQNANNGLFLSTWPRQM